ncbi:MAG: ribonuclease III [Deltaproteobacteria bacterium]|nr:ribonuclease III [Deltaproteobacteria bacterium]
MSKPYPSELEKKLGYSFTDPALLEEALRHSSFVNEMLGKGLSDNERLEFLGDAVVNLITGHLLMMYYPDFNEGHLSRMRAHLVNEFQLSNIACELNLGEYVQLGKGESQTQGRKKPSILANTFEALMAAVYLDGGYPCVFQIVSRYMKPLMVANAPSVAVQDYKSKFQELIQSSPGPLPNYTVAAETGPDHDKMFIVQLTCEDIQTEGFGKSKKNAEQNAARKAIDIFMKHASS